MSLTMTEAPIAFESKETKSGGSVVRPIFKDDEFEKIAKEELFIETLKEQGMDDLDFHSVSVASIKAALQSAFELGQKANKK